MTPELTALTLAALLQAIQFALMAIPANLKPGIGKTPISLDPNRAPSAPMRDKQALSTRTFANHPQTS
jgi:hypothetical protein